MNDLIFLNEIEKASGEKISSCYQCYKCTIGCPVVSQMDIYPHRIIRHIILGNREKALSSKSIWVCLQCITCSIRCPNDIDIAHVFDTLRKIAVKEHKEAQRDLWRFDELFLDSVMKHGRLYEIETILRYKLKKKDFFGDTKMGIGMLTKGRIGVFPHNIRGRKQLQEILRRIEASYKK